MSSKTSENLRSISSLATILAVSILFASVTAASIAPVSATTSVQSSISAFLSCPSSISFSAPAGASQCSSASYTGAYKGIAQTVGTSQNSVFFFASANGGVKVNYSLTDTTTLKPLMRWVGYGSIAGGSCSSPSVVVPAAPVSGSKSYVISTGAMINSGDTLKESVNVTFTGTGTPEFCTGGAIASLISIGTYAATGSGQAILTTSLMAGKAKQSSLQGFNGVSESYINTGGGSITALVLGVLKNNGGGTVDVLSTSVTASAGANVTAFLALKNYPSGAYTMTVIAMTSQFAPASTAESATVIV